MTIQEAWIDLMTKRIELRRHRPVGRIHLLDGQNYEALLPVEILRYGTSQSYDLSNPAVTDRRFPKTNPAGTRKLLHRRQWRTERRGGPGNSVRWVTRISSDAFTGMFDGGRLSSRPSVGFLPELFFHRAPDLLSGREVEFATCSFKVGVTMPNGNPGIASLTAVIDKATRSVVATKCWTRGFPPPE